jgi:hypothetical protein
MTQESNKKLIIDSLKKKVFILRLENAYSSALVSWFVIEIGIE